jgi:uncharacterized SAM-binding protein YcdF (DUF218 family)
MFALSKLLGFLLLPTTLLALLAAAGCLLALLHRRCGTYILMLTSACLLVLLCTSLDDLVLSPLEDRFPRPAQLPSHIDGIIVLGGSINLSVSYERRQFSFHGGSEALVEAVALARRYPTAKLIFSGGSAAGEDLRFREADVAREIFLSLGVDPSRIIYERNSRNTHENALFTKHLVKPAPGQVWVLVAAASDTPRDVGCFRGVGWPVIAWPSGYRTGGSTAWIGWPQIHSFTNLDLAAHEWAGLVYYHLRGWTDALFPAPEPAAITPNRYAS